MQRAQRWGTIAGMAAIGAFALHAQAPEAKTAEQVFKNIVQSRERLPTSWIRPCNSFPRPWV